MVLRPGVNYIIYNEFSKIQVQGENKSSWPMFANWRKRGKMSKQTELYDSKWWLVLNSSQKGKFSRVTFQPQVWRLALHISTNGNHDPMTQKYQATSGTLLSPANICVSIFKKCSFFFFFPIFTTQLRMLSFGISYEVNRNQLELTFEILYFFHLCKNALMKEGEKRALRTPLLYVF